MPIFSRPVTTFWENFDGNFADRWAVVVCASSFYPNFLLFVIHRVSWGREIVIY